MYIGQTGRSRKHRLKGHRRALRNGDVAISALAEHALMAGHGIDLSKTEVVDSNPYTPTRCMLESWQIQHKENKLNRERGNLLELYAALLDWTFTLRHYTITLHWHPSHPSHLYYHAHCHVTHLHLFHPFNLNFNIILTLFIVVVTSYHPIWFNVLNDNHHNTPSNMDKLYSVVHSVIGSGNAVEHNHRLDGYDTSLFNAYCFYS